MTRELRPRKSKPSYSALLADSGDELTPQPEDDGSSDDFKQEVEVEVESEEENSDVHLEVEGSLILNEHLETEDEDEDENDPSVKGKGKGKAAAKFKRRPPLKSTNTKKTTVKPSEKRGNSSLPTFLTRPSTRQNHSLPTPAPDHRYRSGPLYRTTNDVERLVEIPVLFKEPSLRATRNWTYNENVTDRYNKASGYNIGPGPLWDFMEDRSWWKESIEDDTSGWKEEKRRPRVHSTVNVGKSWKVIDKQAAKEFLPLNVEIRENGEAEEIRLPCYFGPFEQQSKRDLGLFDTVKMSEYFPRSKSYVFNAGAPVWSIDWCPIFVEDRSIRNFKQYLAVGPLPSTSHSTAIGHKCLTPSPACIQIWSFSSNEESGPKSTRRGKEKASDDLEPENMRCELVLCIDIGPAHELKWCPLPSNDPWIEPSTTPRKLGLIGGTFEDGSFSIFIVPDPEDVRNGNASEPTYIHIDPLVHIVLEETVCLCMDWADSEMVLIGCTNGYVAVYNLKDALEGNERDILPSHYYSLHQSAIRTVAWIKQPNTSAEGKVEWHKSPTIIATGGYDGCIIFSDLREQSGNMINRTRDVIHSIAYSSYSIGIFSIDHENLVKVFSIHPSMLGRGHGVIEPGGPVWDIHSSDYHPQLTVGSADGSLMTTNALKSTRRSSTTPFLSYKIFQLDFNRKTQEFRMLEQFLPQEILDRNSAVRAKRKGNQKAEVPVIGTGVWPPEISVTRVVWNTGNGLGHAPLVASATASGLCRIDWLLGRFVGDRVPYGGIEAIRMEVQGDGELQDEDD